MSAFQVNDEHINAIVQAVHGVDYNGFNIWKYQDDEKAYHFKSGLLHTAQTEANELMAENIRSVNYRYKESSNTKCKVKLNLKTEPLSALEVLKLIDCLEYQSCETDDYNNTLAYKLLCKYRTVMVGRLPGYSAAKWCL